MTTGAFRPQQGAVAAGHEETVRAASEVLEAGGNAVDAALAASLMACVAEPVLASVGGSGFAIVRPAAGDPEIIDFFAQTPVRRNPESDRAFFPIDADFGTTTQRFHVGLGAAATPGFVPGVFEISRRYGSLPMAEVAAPAIAAARAGVTVNRFQSFLFGVVSPIYRHDPAGSACFGGSAANGLVAPGDLMRNEALAETFEHIVDAGPETATCGELAKAMAMCAADHGGHLTPEDLRAYRVHARAPLSLRFRGSAIETNPAPSSGGTLIAFALALIEASGLDDGKAIPARDWVRVMAQSQRARIETGFLEDPDAAGTLLSAETVATHARQLAGHPPATRGTTHISVVDGAGNAAGITLTNGEGCGVLVPGCGFMLNNMLGEEDINPSGLGVWPENVRMSSMMAPSLIEHADGGVTVLGSGGSNRIRTAMTQVIERLTRRDSDLETAIDAPRLHVEGRTAFAEIFDGRSVDEAAFVADGQIDTVRVFDEPSMFFGGVHAVRVSPQGIRAVGDRRRAGCAVVVPVSGRAG